VKTIVCVKQVPASTRVEIDPETKTLVREGVAGVLNPLDAFAVEEALRIRQRLGGSVIALTLGPPQAERMLREVMALGVDEGVLVTGREFAGSDTWATSYALACAVRSLGAYDLILCGKQAVDGDTAHVGPQLAARLGLPQATFVRRIRELAPGRAVVERLTDAGSETLRLPLPAVLSVVKDINEPRLPNLADLCRARFARVRALDPASIGAERSCIGLDGSRTRVVRIFTPASARAGRIYEDDIEAGIEDAADLIAKETQR
jgi:electron transfer flavoprotein beta subunit